MLWMRIDQRDERIANHGNREAVSRRALHYGLTIPTAGTNSGALKGDDTSKRV
jgi:hypothetical protein